MPTSMSSSYGIIIPDLCHFIIVNAQPGEDLDELIIINSSPTTDHQASTIHDYNHIRSMLFDNGPAYTTLQMEFTTNIHGSVATARFLDDEDEDHEASMTIARFIIHHQSLYGADGISEEKSPVEIVGIGKEEAGGEICVICQKAYEEYEMMGRLLECRHGYHVECINRWLLHKNVCPICRATVSWL
ncbi:Zinc finger, RING/FYVE/PHD-type [Cynara cardunculus var. scolymus]|uniref:RING-type E3 ubiquitin transferase n=1 Tax=Cynara cardunculus var. scolymus TaxID=59895 RepID=A0A103XDJ3_CYNCS|nr:Zinc finger, RING/FYVE/PHD-type [Cynara cardunculus var. scolymus]